MICLNGNAGNALKDIDLEIGIRKTMIQLYWNASHREWQGEHKSGSKHQMSWKLKRYDIILYLSHANNNENIILQLSVTFRRSSVSHCSARTHTFHTQLNSISKVSTLIFLLQPLNFRHAKCYPPALFTLICNGDTEREGQIAFVQWH